MAAASNRNLLGATERKLYDRITALLPEGEEIRAAFVVFTGPRAGADVGIIGLFGVIAGAIGALVAGSQMNRSRSFMTVAVTDRGVVTFANRSLRVPTAPPTRYPDLSVIGEINDTFGDSYVEIAGERYWIEGIWSMELYKVKRLRPGS